MKLKTLSDGLINTIKPINKINWRQIKMTQNQNIEQQVPQQQHVLTPVREYTKADLDNATQKNELGKYLRFGEPLKAQMQEALNRTDLETDDLIAFAIKNTFGIDAQPKHIGRSWNNRIDTEKRIGLRQIEPQAQIPVSADSKVLPSGLTDELIKSFVDYATKANLEATKLREAFKSSGWNDDQVSYCIAQLNKPVALIMPTMPKAEIGTLGLPLPKNAVPVQYGVIVPKQD